MLDRGKEEFSDYRVGMFDTDDDKTVEIRKIFLKSN